MMDGIDSMRHGLMPVLCMAVMLYGGIASAQGVPGKSMTRETPPDAVINADPHHLAGIWTLRSQLAPVLPVLQPQYATVSARNLQPGSGPRGSTDPAQQCVPHGFFGGAGTYPTLIMQTAQQITLMNEENHRFRRIYLGGRHPQNLKPSFAGHSIGHWQGDTLVVDTVGLRTRDGATALPDYHIVERIRKIDGGRQLEIKVTYDSAAHAMPGSQITLLNFRPDLHIQEQICEEFPDNFNDSYKFK